MTLFESVFAGNDAVYGLTEGAINQAIEKYGADKAVSFPDTAYSLPCYYAVTGTKVGTLAELKDALAVVKTLMTREKRTNDVFMSGVATALCAEFIEVLKYIDGAVPYEAPCYGHLADAVIRELGVPLVTGDIPGVAVILGKAPSAQEAADLVKSYQSQGILITLVGDVIDQLEEVGYKTGANVRVIPLGKDVTAVIHVVSVALRAALIFGNVKPGDAATLMDYTMKRVPAFVNAFAPLNDVIVACGAGAIALGFPVITNQEDVARVPKSLICQKDISKWNATSLEARDIKIKITNIDIPVAFASAFEGEIIRRKDMQVEFDGSRVDCAELVHTCDASEVEDHKITVVGPEVDDMELGSKNSIALLLKLQVKTCSLTLNLLSSVSSITTSTVSKVYTIQDREICRESVSAKMHLLQASRSNISVKFSIHRLRMNLTQLLINVKLLFIQILLSVQESVMKLLSRSSRNVMTV